MISSLVVVVNITADAIGQYNTSPHQCEYCYASASKELATENWHRHQLDPHSELIIPQDKGI
jgi:hypothetical protein